MSDGIEVTSEKPVVSMWGDWLPDLMAEHRRVSLERLMKRIERDVSTLTAELRRLLEEEKEREAK